MRERESNQGMLYLCATPIGNLKDITQRVIECLSGVDLIAAEDTRNSIHLLTHFNIKTPMTSYHEFNKIEKAKTLIAKMKSGLDIALITDAGTPGISDPGEVLVDMCHQEGIIVTSLPGPAACITALTMSGLPTRRFCFEAFLPQDKKEKRVILEELKDETRTIIIYEAPHRLIKTLGELYEALGDRRMSVCKELTKRFESVVQISLKDAVDYYKDHEPKGEHVLVIEGRSREDIVKEQRESFESMSIEEHMQLYEAQGMDRKSAMKAVAKDRGISKRDVYDYLLTRGE